MTHLVSIEGALTEKLFTRSRATTDPRLKQQISLELSFVDSNIKVLRDQLAELNTAVHAYQNDRCLLNLIAITNYDSKLYKDR